MTTAQEQATDWVAVDWGTTHVRLWCLAADGTILTRRTSDQGMGQITAEAYESVLLQLLADHLPADAALDVVVCGMAGSRQGWIEAPYVATPVIHGPELWRSLHPSLIHGLTCISCRGSNNRIPPM